MEETVVLVDDDGRDIGTMSKRLVHHRDTPLHLAFSCYVFDRERNLLVTRRAGHKNTWPGVWTNTCCGHPSPGEPMTDAVKRRLVDELGLTPAGEIALVLPRFRYRATMADGTVENELCPVLTAVAEGDPVPDPDEVDGWTWVPWPEFAASVQDGTREVSPWCRRQIPQLTALGPDPLAWPAAPHGELPRAAVWS